VEPSETTAQVLRARDGSRADLDALLEHYSGKLLALIRLRMGPDLRRNLESRDILQNTLLKAFGAIERFEGEGSVPFMAWLGQIARNEIRDQVDHQQAQRRDARREVALDDAGELVAEVRTATRRVALGEQARQLEVALEALEPDQREVIVLRKLEELSFPEIGERMERSPDAARMLFARAMVTLTVEMGR